MKVGRLFWKEKRFSWFLVSMVVLFTALLLFADWYWRTHDTNLSKYF